MTTTRDIITDKAKTIPGYNIYEGFPGILAGSGHFLLDHFDVTYSTEYQNDTLHLGMEVVVTQHAGGDSDKWLVHELDIAFRDKYGMPSLSYTPRVINGQTIMIIAIGGRNYRWLSGNKVIEIEYHGSLRTLPEPIEVVQAYLLKHPSTLPSFTLQDLRSAANKSNWIKDEMDRRLWLCDKWLNCLQLGKVKENEAYSAMVESIKIFLDYREKYFHSLFVKFQAAPDKIILDQLLSQNDSPGIKLKLKEYRDWWAKNKEKSIRL